MARGGQGGLSWLGEEKVSTALGTTVIILVTQAWLGCIGMPGSANQDSPQTDNNEECAEIAAKEARGETLNEDEAVIFNMPWCQSHMVVVDAKAAAEQQTELREAQQELQEAKTP
jgi:hypothetical protein